MPQVDLAAGWERASAPVALLLAPLGPAAIWFAAAATFLLVAWCLRTRRPAAGLALAVLASLALAVAADGLVDDAYIQFRYAANLAAGHGPYFNPGEHLEGASGGLWIALIAALSATTGVSTGAVARTLSLLAAPLTTLVAGLTGRRLRGPEAGVTLAIIWAALPTSALYAATGLETAPFALALWLAVWGVATERGWAAVTGGILIATLRPEGVLLVACAIPFWPRLPRAARLGITAAATAGAALTAARLLLYGSPVPRSVLVKGVTAAAGPALGGAYLGHAVLEWWPLLASVPLLARRHRDLAPALLPAGVWTALVALRGGDWMPGSRYLLPLLVMLVAAAAWMTPRVRAAVAAAMVAWGLILLVPRPQPSPPVVGALWREMAEHRVQSRWWEALGTFLRHAFPAGTTVATGPAGALPFASDLPTFDMYGLCSKVRTPGHGAAGHRLWGLTEAIATRPDVIYLGRPIPQSDEAAARRTAEEEAGQTPELGLRYRAVLVRHQPEASLDVVSDLLWIRRGLGVGATQTGGATATGSSRNPL
jgi:arabinofuranosyltransferase